MPKKRRIRIQLLVITAIAFPAYGCGDGKPEMPTNPPVAPAKSSGPPTAASSIRK